MLSNANVFTTPPTTSCLLKLLVKSTMKGTCDFHTRRVISAHKSFDWTSSSSASIGLYGTSVYDVGCDFSRSYRLDRPFPCRQSEKGSTRVQEGE